MNSRRLPGIAVLGLLLALALVLSLADARRDSAIADEPLHVVAGVTQVQSGTWLVNVEHPPLAKQLFGVGAVWAGAAEKPELSYRDLFRATRAYLFQRREGRPLDSVLLGARLAAIALFLALLSAAFWASGGGPTGLMAVALLLGDAALFPHGHFATTDVPVTLFFVLVVGTLARLLATQSGRHSLMLAFGLAFAMTLALATKYSGILVLFLVPGALLVAALRETERSRRLRSLALAAAVPLLSVFFLTGLLRLYMQNDRPGSLDVLTRLYGTKAADRDLLHSVERVDTALARYAFGLLFVVRQSEAGRLTYFLDRPEAHPSSAYHVVTVLVKSPIVWLAACAWGAVLAFRRDAGTRARFFFLCGLFLFAASLPGPRIGIRHVFPSLALFTLGAAASLTPWLTRVSPRALGIALAIAISPLAFGRSLGRNGLLGDVVGRPLLADSNLDWGQDLLRLGEEARMRGVPLEELSVAYFGGDLSSVRLPAASDLLESDSAPRRYLAISRQFLLLGPQAALFPEGVPRTRRALDLLRAAPERRFLFRAGDSIEVWELPAVSSPPRSEGTDR